MVEPNWKQKMRKRQSILTFHIIIFFLLLGSLGVTNAIGEDCCQLVSSLQGSVDKEMLEQYLMNTYENTSTIPKIEPLITMQRELLAKAEPDECFCGIGATCPQGCVPNKVNQAYVWAMVKSGDNIWFGTATNVNCLMTYASSGQPNPAPKESYSYVCEFGESPICKGLVTGYPDLPDYAGDWRPPRIYVYNTVTKELTDKTPQDNRINQNMGIRAAGALGEVVIMGGPALSSAGSGIHLFAYNASTGDYLGATTLSEYGSIRKWLAVNDVLYTAVSNKSGGGGLVLRWRGELEYVSGKPDLNSLFRFEVVGTLDSEPADMALHDNRIFISTWPNGLGLGGLYMGPVIPADGLTNAHLGAWEKVWDVSNYEPDPVTARATGGGALASFDGYLYWGTMYIPFGSTLYHFAAYYDGVAPESHEVIEAAFLGSHRSISIFRGRNFDSTTEKEIQLLYGMEQLPVFNPATRQWVMVNNKTGAPLYGPSGFGNFFNNYTWSMAVYDGQLFVGTMDFSYLVMDELSSHLKEIFPCPHCDFEISLPVEFFCGGDLYRFPSSDSPAIPESITGVGNFTNYGVRNMIVDDDALYLGMANPMNLLTDPNDSMPEGGWELIKLTPRGPIPCQNPLPDAIGECEVTLVPPRAVDCSFNIITATTTDPTFYNTLGTYQVIWKYDAGGGRVTYQQQTVKVVDTKPPVPDVDPLPDVVGLCKVTLTPPTATDNCVGTITGTPNHSLTFCVPGIYTVTWTYNDGKGNITTQEQKVVVKFLVDPKFGLFKCVLNPWNKLPIPVTIYGCEGFDVTTISPESIRLSREGVSEEARPTYWHYTDTIRLPIPSFIFNQDQNRDGIKDLVVFFDSQELIRQLKLDEVAGQAVSATMKGELKPGSAETSFDTQLNFTVNSSGLSLPKRPSTEIRQDYRRNNLPLQ